MNKVMLAVILAISVNPGSYAQVFTQATIDFDNSFNTNLTPSATSEGAVFSTCPSGPADHFNLQLFGGASPNNLSLIATLLQSDGSAVTGSEIGAPGQWIDGTGQTYIVPGVPALGTGFFQVLVWEGDQYSSYDAAQGAGSAYFGSSPVFQNPTGGGYCATRGFDGHAQLSLWPVRMP